MGGGRSPREMNMLVTCWVMRNGLHSPLRPQSLTTSRQRPVVLGWVLQPGQRGRGQDGEDRGNAALRHGLRGAPGARTNRTDGRPSAHPCAPRGLHLLRGGPPSPASLRNRDLEAAARVLARNAAGRRGGQRGHDSARATPAGVGLD